MNTIIIEKLSKVLKDVLEKFGKLYFFGIVRREGQATWDILISGENIADKAETAMQVIKIMQKYISKEEVTVFARLVILKQNNLFIKSFTSLIKIENGIVNINKTKINNILISEAIVFYSSKG